MYYYVHQPLMNGPTDHPSLMSFFIWSISISCSSVLEVESMRFVKEQVAYLHREMAEGLKKFDCNVPER
jgi:hypothetical protein